MFSARKLQNDPMHALRKSRESISGLRPEQEPSRELRTQSARAIRRNRGLFTLEAFEDAYNHAKVDEVS